MAASTPSNGRPLLSVSDAYARWAATYDTDGNPLQALDSIALRELLPQFLRQVRSASGPARPLVVDVGCGTGRNTLALLKHVYSPAEGSGRQDTASAIDTLSLDASEQMLARCEAKVKSLLDSTAALKGARLHASFEVFDLLADDLQVDSPGVTDAQFAPPWGQAAGVVSTLVAEHLPAVVPYFRTCARMLRSGGVLLVTNMHPDMGVETGAGFTDGKDGGKKVRVDGYVHTVEGFEAAAKAAGLVPMHEGPRAVLERTVEEWMVRGDVEGLGRRGNKWQGRNIWMGGLWKKRDI